MEEKRLVYIYDIEQLANLHTCTFVHADNVDERHVFVIYDDEWNDFEDYVKFLRQPGLKLVGYNCINYDYPILDYILRMEKHISAMPARKIASLLYEYSQKILSQEIRSIPDWNTIIPQRDLYRVHHYDNKNRATSLKHLQVAMKWLNVEDMPFDHDHWIESRDEIKAILSYNLNDVLSTRQFYLMSQDEIALRRALTKKFKINLMNASDAKIGQEIMLSSLAKAKDVPLRELKASNGTDRTRIPIKSILLPGIRFYSKPFIRVLDTLRQTTALGYKLKGSFSAKAVLDGMEYSFGFGGIHACRSPRVYRSTSEEIIRTVDVASYYPNIGIANRFYPEHLGEDFCDVYSHLYAERKSYPKDQPENYGLKIALNGVYGKSNEEQGPLRDARYTLQITVNGQLQLAMLCERFYFAGIHVIMVNTDGIECMVKRGYEEVYHKICNEWEEETGLELEHGEYEAIALRDVNNYIAVKPENSGFKAKGDYELAETRAKMHWWHKDPSTPVIPYVAMRHLIYGDDIMQALKSHEDILDFALYARAKGNAAFYVRKINGDSQLEDTKIQRTVRYFISNHGSYLVKVFDDGREVKFHKTYKVMLANRLSLQSLKLYSESRDEWLDYRYYYQECMKLVTPMKNRQVNLFEI